jgi:GntR family transcriptional regulator/MocR family aminotransferase
LHLAARIRDPSHADRIIAMARACTPGAQPVSEYSITDDVPPAIAFGYGVIDAHDIPAALIRLRRALER